MAIIVTSRAVEDLAACADRVVCLFKSSVVAEFGAIDIDSRKISLVINGSPLV
jgi:ABC-type sugar transport system ATPase subunit